jgi:pimeloyl-ACP methyl ester carboxylesterase|eukprot:COSAG06_NODE_4070_length_4606_cov_39.200799_3_plen_206_part_00
MVRRTDHVQAISHASVIVTPQTGWLLPACPCVDFAPLCAHQGTISIDTVAVGDLEFRYRSAGPPDATQAIIALHGFPETSISYTLLLEAGAAAGYRVIAPDQRGYSPGAQPDPADTSHYYYDKIVDDVIAIAAALGIERFHLVAHDHGCLVGWCAAARYPQHVASYCPMSVPHPDAFSKAMVSDPEQQAASRAPLPHRPPPHTIL